MIKKRSAKNLFWDLGNTLLTINKLSFAKKVGMLDFLLYPLLDRKHPKQIFHKSLDLIDSFEVSQNFFCQAKAEGRFLPSAVCQWLAGTITHEKALSYIKNPLYKRAPEKFFSSAREARLAHNFLKTMSDPEALASLVSIIKEGIELLKECSEQRDQKGNQLHSLFILSNWDPYSFEAIMKATHLQELFSYFDRSNLIISGNIGSIKPHDEIYTYVLDTYNLTPSDCILIDDQIENIIGAEKHGMQGIHLKKDNYDEVREQLLIHRVIKAY